MNRQQGSAVAMVMLVLAVVSLIGVAMLTQSRMDMQLTSSFQVYDDITSRADAAATERLVQLRGKYRYDVPAYTAGPTPPTLPDPDDPSQWIPDTTRIVPGFPLLDEKADPNARVPANAQITSAFASDRTDVVGYTVHPPSGWQKGAAPDGYVEVYYVVKGRAWNPYAYRGQKEVSPGVWLYDVPETTVTVTATVVRKRNP